MSKSNNREKAVALKYNPDTNIAPVVIASGYGQIAQGIIDIAEQKGIPVYKDDSAASMLCMLEVGNNIPPELYEIVATIYTELLKTAGDIKYNNKSVPKKPSIQLKSRQSSQNSSSTSNLNISEKEELLKK